MQSPYLGARIELIEVTPFPRSLLRVPAGAVDSRDVGFYHLSVDATRACLSLDGLLSSWNSESLSAHGKSIRVVVPATRTVVAGRPVETLMIADSDGNIIEILREVWEEATDFVDPNRLGPDESQRIFEWKDDGDLGV